MSVRTRIEVTCDFCLAESYVAEGEASEPSFWQADGFEVHAPGAWLLNTGIVPRQLPDGWEHVTYPVHRDDWKGARVRCPGCVFDEIVECLA